MRTNLISIQTAGTAAALALAAGLCAAAQQPGAVRTAEQQFKNIQVLKGIPANEVVPAMHVIEKSLGVDCEFCHVADRSKDDMATKETARQMIAMVLNLNKTSFAGKTQVTCFTCHHGNADPITVPPLPQGEAMMAAAEEPPAAAPSLPAVDQVLAKYVQALGGEQALRKVTSRLITATWELPTGPGGNTPVAAQLERYEKAPNLVVSVNRTAKFTTAQGFDGTTAWLQDAMGAVTDAPAIDQGHLRRNADLYQSLDLKQQFAGLTVAGIEKVNGHDAYVVAGAPAGERPERLFFDTKTGLLLREEILVRTPIGDNPIAEEYDDYRDTGSGVKFPFVIRSIPGAPYTLYSLLSHSTIRVQKVQDNVPVDDAKFVKPQSKPAGQ
jgi:photosynthetic reaction center cytochrome c subunit